MILMLKKVEISYLADLRKPRCVCLIGRQAALLAEKSAMALKLLTVIRHRDDASWDGVL
jgi:hypothetical protein